VPAVQGDGEAGAAGSAEATRVREVRARLRSEGLLDLRDAVIDAAAVEQILAAAPRDPRDPERRLIRRCDCAGATFGGYTRFDDVSFGEAIFTGAALDAIDFSGAIFEQEARFELATLGMVDFLETTFEHGANFGGASFTGYANFDAATFAGHTSFADATFAEWSRFQGTVFGAGVSFSRSRFEDGAAFEGTRFAERANFEQAAFGEHVSFGDVVFAGDAKFSEASFEDLAIFSGTTFRRTADFRDAAFAGEAVIRDVEFRGDALFRDGATPLFARAAAIIATTFGSQARFGRSTFAGTTVMRDVAFAGDADFAAVRFEKLEQFGPLWVAGTLRLDNAVLVEPVAIEASARAVSMVQTMCVSGADLLLRWADVSMERARFTGPSLVAELPHALAADGSRRLHGWERLRDDGVWCCDLHAPPEGFAPRVMSLRGAKVEQLTLSGVDLRACRFVGAHGLDRLRIERAPFAQPPSGPLQSRRWTRRQAIAEEHLWRTIHGFGAHWGDEEVIGPDWLLRGDRQLQSEQIAGVYRALRKAREDAKDEPGAADLYYGEMEMRRRSPKRPINLAGWAEEQPTPAAERWILTAYWLVAGYGLRASRALTTLALVVALAAISLDRGGFEPGSEHSPALLFAIESSVGLLRPPSAALTNAGEIVQIVLRLLGPLLLGLALLSFRGRVKR